MGHYGGRGMRAVAMVHRVITIYEDVCCILCVCCTEDYFHVVKTIHGQFFLAVAHGDAFSILSAGKFGRVGAAALTINQIHDVRLTNDRN